MDLAPGAGPVLALGPRSLGILGALALLALDCAAPKQPPRPGPPRESRATYTRPSAYERDFGVGKPSRLRRVGVPPDAPKRIHGAQPAVAIASPRGVRGDGAISVTSRDEASSSAPTAGLYAARTRGEGYSEGHGQEHADARIIEAEKGRGRSGGTSLAAVSPVPRGKDRRASSDEGPGSTRIITNFEGALQVPAGRSIQVRLARPAERVAISDPEVAEVVLISPYEILVNGKGRREDLKTGAVSIREAQTSLIVWDRDGRSDRRTLYVNRSRTEQILLEVTVAEVNRSAIEQYGVDFNFFHNGNFFSSTPAKIVSPGNSLTQTFPAGPGMTGNFPLSAERLTFLYRNFNQDFTVFIEALQRESLAKILARPVVLARSGEQAHFRVGGEIPIVYATSNVATINFKEFGVLLTFTPVFTDDGKIDLQVKMEVSEPTSAFSTSFAGFEVPAFVSRQAETRALLEQGQTLLLGGLYREQTSESEDKVPYLGDIPLLGMLFRKTVFNTSRTELLMAVRPAVAGGASELAVERLPTDRPPLSREEVRTQQNPYGVTRPRVGRRPAPQNDADWPTVQEYLKEKSGRSVD